MTSYYLRIEGVNYSDFIYDTADLSTIRGGGLLLLHAVDCVKYFLKEKEKVSNLKTVMTGASIGLFRFESDDGEAVRKDVEEFLCKHKYLRYATFVVDVIEADGGSEFKELREKLTAMNRFRQMKSPTLAVPPVNRNGKDVCEIDRVRPAESERNAPEGKTEKVSLSVMARSDYGRNMKQKFYDEDETGLKLNNDFARSFEEIAYIDEEELKALNRKMAVIYVDGNKFGEIQRKLDEKGCENFNGYIKGKRKKFLETLLKTFDSDERWIYVKGQEKRYRIETLLWGGDEFILVVPAWKGWATLKTFYESADAMQFNGTELFHAAGIVFCHHNAPIQRITRLAEDLCGLAKDKNRKKNLFAYQILESFDHTAAIGLEKYRKRMCPEGCAPADLVMEGAVMPDFEENFKVIKKTFPRSKLHRIVTALISGKKADDIIEKTEKELDDKSRKAICGLKKMFNGKEDILWVHMAELWDYVGI